MLFKIYDIELMKSLNKEYESKKVVSSFIEYNPEFQMKRSYSRILKLSKLIDFKGKNILEIGCGEGYDSYQLAQGYGCNVVGVDVKKSSVWDTLAHPNLRLAALDLSGDNPFYRGQFDIIVSFTVWEHIRHPFAMLGEAVKLLKPDGLLYISANLYRSAISSHLYRQIYFPFPHLLFEWNDIAQFAIENGAERKFIEEFFSVNKLTYSEYKEYFETLGLELLDEKKSIRKLDKDFYDRFEDKLGLYPVHDLELDFFHVLLSKKQTGGGWFDEECGQDNGSL